MDCTFEKGAFSNPSKYLEGCMVGEWEEALKWKSTKNVLYSWSFPIMEGNILIVNGIIPGCALIWDIHANQNML